MPQHGLLERSKDEVFGVIIRIRVRVRLYMSPSVFGRSFAEIRGLNRVCDDSPGVLLDLENKMVSVAQHRDDPDVNSVVETHDHELHRVVFNVRVKALSECARTNRPLADAPCQ